jgi:hypothetical protein
MTTHDHHNPAVSIRSELESTRKTFQTVLDSLSEGDLRRQSLNPGWTNGEILAHILFGFIILDALLPIARVWGRFPKSSSRPLAWLLNASTRPFNWINALGAHLQGRVFTYKRSGKLFDNIMNSLKKKVQSIKEEEWEHGMYYPTKWDSNFTEFKTLEKLLHYPVIHCNFHIGQISRFEDTYTQTYQSKP